MALNLGCKLRIHPLSNEYPIGILKDYYFGGVNLTSCNCGREQKVRHYGNILESRNFSHEQFWMEQRQKEEEALNAEREKVGKEIQKNILKSKTVKTPKPRKPKKSGKNN